MHSYTMSRVLSSSVSYQGKTPHLPNLIASLRSAAVALELSPKFFLGKGKSFVMLSYEVPLSRV